MDQAPPSMGFSRQEYWSGLLFPSPGDLPDPGIEPGSPTLQADAFPPAPPGKPWCTKYRDFPLVPYPHSCAASLIINILEFVCTFVTTDAPIRTCHHCTSAQFTLSSTRGVYFMVLNKHTVTRIPPLQDHTQWFHRHKTFSVPLVQEPLGTKHLFTALLVLTFRELHVESYILFRPASFTWWASPVAQTVRTCPRCGGPGFTMDRGAWWATVHGAAETQTQLSNWHFHFLSLGNIHLRFLHLFLGSSLPLSVE